MNNSKGQSSSKNGGIQKNIEKIRIIDHKGFLKLMCLERQYLNKKIQYQRMGNQPLSPEIWSKQYVNKMNPQYKKPYGYSERIVQRTNSLKNSLKLPSIQKRSTKNTSLSKQNSSSFEKKPKRRYKNGPATEPKDEITTTNMSNSSSFSPRKMMLDSQASRQLQMLNQFEKAVVHSRMSNGGNSNILKKY